jgi:hypothetical protein
MSLPVFLQFVRYDFLFRAVLDGPSEESNCIEAGPLSQEPRLRLGGNIAIRHMQQNQDHLTVTQACWSLGWNGRTEVVMLAGFRLCRRFSLQPCSRHAERQNLR